MCKRNSPDKKKACTGCVREPSRINMKPVRDVYEKLTRLKKKKKKSRSQHGMCKRNFPGKNKASTGCVRETPEMKIKPARDM